MGKAFVTGASGFIGRHLVSRLIERGSQVRCLVRRSSSVRHLTKLGVELCRGDVGQTVEELADAMRGCDEVYHLAGITCSLSRAQMMEVNARGAARVARACDMQPTPPVLLLVSSIAAAGPAPAGGVRNESDSSAPVSVYGWSKRQGEAAVEALAHRVPATIVRPGIVFGPWNREMLPMFRAIRDIRLHAVPTFAPPPLSLIHVTDLTELLVRAAERGRRIDAASRTNGNGSRPGYYFGCDSEYPNYVDLGRLAARFMGRSHVLWLHLAEPLPWIIASVAEAGARLRGKPEILNLDKIREAMAASWAMSTEAARADLDFAPAASLEERMEDTVRWYRQRGWL